MRFSLRVLLAFCLAGLQFVAVLIVVFSSYFTSEQALIAHARDLLRDVGVNAIEHSKGFLNPAQGAAELAARLAQNRVVASDDQRQLEQLLFQQLQIAPQFASVYYGNAQGDFVFVTRADDGIAPFRSKIIENKPGHRRVKLIWRNDNFDIMARRDDPNDSFDPRNRPWYTMAKTRVATIWTDPYIFFSSQQPGITLAAPVMNGAQQVKGIVGVDIEIHKISDFLSRLKIGTNGKAMIIHKNGDVIAHPNPHLIKARNDDGTLRFANIEEFEDPIARAAFAPMFGNGEILVDQTTPSQFTYNGEVYVSTVMPPISFALPWIIGVYAPENDFTAIIKRNRASNIWIAAFVGLVTGGIGLLLAELIHRPVRAFAVRAALISQGEVDPSEAAPRTYQELERANTTLMQQIAARRSAESEYGQTFDLSSRAMAQFSANDGTILRANSKFGAILGAPPPEVIGRKLDDFAAADPLQSSVSLYGPLQDSSTDHEMRWQRLDGASVWVKLNSIIIRGDKGQALHGVLTVDDITEAKTREAQLGQLNRDLSHLARGNTMGEMAAGLAHELNQPLTAIAQNADAALLTLEEGPEKTGELRQIITEIEHQSLRAGDIIRALRGFIRKDEGQRSAFDFANLLDQTVRLIRAEAQEARVEIAANLPALPPVLGNHIQIAQVIVNLLRNGIEAIAATATEPRRVEVNAQLGPDPQQVTVWVEDSGPGIAAGVQLFTQFETNKPDGMGLGLSICRSIIEANGGKLWHEPGVPQGARFAFTLMVAGASDPAVQIFTGKAKRGSGNG